MGSLKERRKALVEEATGIAAAAKDRNGGKTAGATFTDAEAKRVEAIYAEVDGIDAQLAKVDQAAKTIDALSRLDGPAAGGHSEWTKAVLEGHAAEGKALGVKALLSGEVTTPPTVEVVDLPAVPTRLLDLVERVELNEHTFSYLRQTVRDENVDVVPDGEEKPESTYTFVEVEDRARVVAHLSEPFPLRYLSDHTSMADVLEDQMREGVLRKVEQQLVSGTGQGEQFEGILTTSGVVGVEFAGDELVTIRKARTALELRGETPNAWVLHPSDVERIELRRELADDEGGFLMSSAAYEAIFGRGVARIPSAAVPQGMALLADWRQVRLRVRQGAHTLAATQGGSDEHGDLFETNRVRLRAEGRFGIDLRRPQAIAVVELTEGGSS